MTQLPQVQMPDIVGSYQQGKRQPLLEQLDQLRNQQVQQAMDINKRNMSLQDYEREQRRRKEFTNDLKLAARHIQGLPPEKQQQAIANMARLYEIENKGDLFAEFGENPEAFLGLDYAGMKSRPGRVFEATVGDENVFVRDDPSDPRGFTVLEGATPIDKADIAGQKEYKKIIGKEKASQEVSESEAERKGYIKYKEKAAADKQAYRKDLQAQANSLDSQLRNMDRALVAIDQGASSGMMAQHLPTIRRSTAELESAAKSLGIDVINSATFGALSENELKLALDTAVPMNLPPAELKVWLTDRRAATQKLRDEMMKLSKFLNVRGNTLEMWEEMQKSQATQDERIIEDGYEFLGGDKADPKNWRPVND